MFIDSASNRRQLGPHTEQIPKADQRQIMNKDMSNIIRLLLPETKHLDGRTRWTDPIVRVVSVDMMSFPDTLRTSSKVLCRHCEIVQSFVHACQLSLQLIDQIEPRLLPLELYIVRQYFVVVCLRFAAWAKERGSFIGADGKALRNSLDNLDKELQNLEGILLEHWTSEDLSLQVASVVVEEWVVMTVFHHVLVALASTFDLPSASAADDNAFETHVLDTPTGRRWAEATSALRPTAMLINFTDQLVATSVAHWRIGEEEQAKKSRLQPFETLEKEVRRAGMAAETRVLLGKARGALQLFSVHNKPPLPWSESFVKGSAELAKEQGHPTIFSKHCAGKTWLTVRGGSLQNFDQCPACRIKYADVHLPVPNTPEQPDHPLKLGHNWGMKEEWWQPEQCAEDEMFAQIQLIERRSSLPDAAELAASPLLTALRERAAAKLAVDSFLAAVFTGRLTPSITVPSLSAPEGLPPLRRSDDGDRDEAGRPSGTAGDGGGCAPWTRGEVVSVLAAMVLEGKIGHARHARESDMC